MKKFYTRFFLICSMFLIFPFLLTAQKINRKKAESIADTYFNYQLGKNQKKIFSTEKITSSYTLRNTECMFVVSYSQGGFVIVSADERAFPIIGFSTDDNFDINNIAPALKYWLDGYSEQIIQLMNEPRTIQNPMWNDIENERFSANKDISDIPYFVMSRWDQGQSYNDSCPLHANGPNGHCYAGCVATAMGQILYYYKKPTIGMGSHTYYHAHYGNISCTFQGTHYGWEQMTNNITPASRPYIAQLLYHCGVSVDMNYNPNGSGAYTQNVASVLPQFFGYPTAVRYVERFGNPFREWKQALLNSLELHRPILYSGSGTGGHAWVCSGYKDTAFFHMNWGWSGYGNGYFIIDNLVVGDNNFNQGQAAILNIAPYGSPYCTGTKQMVTTNGYVFDGSANSPYQNNSDCKFVISSDSSLIRLAFMEFDTEWNADFVRVYDGETTDSPLLGEFSGNQIPPEVISSGHRLMIHFVTNDSIQASGWLAKHFAFIQGVDEINQKPEITIYPNPANELLFVNTNQINSNQPALIQIFNAAGQKVKEQYSFIRKDESLKINVSNLEEGVYMLLFSSENKVISSKFSILKNQ